MDADRQAAPQHDLHLLMEDAGVALHHAAQIDAEMDEPIKLCSVGKPLRLHPIEILKGVDDIRGQAVDVAEGIARSQKRILVRNQLRIHMLRRAVVVRPVVDRGNAAVRKLSQPEHNAVVEIGGIVKLGRGPLCREIFESVIRKEIAS